MHFYRHGDEAKGSQSSRLELPCGPWPLEVPMSEYCFNAKCNAVVGIHGLRGPLGAHTLYPACSTEALRLQPMIRTSRYTRSTPSPPVYVSALVQGADRVAEFMSSHSER